MENESEIVTNAATTTCCGEAPENCSCGGHKPEPTPVVNRAFPFGGGLGMPEWHYQGNGVINFSRSAVVEAPVVQNAKPGQPNYLLAGAGQFDPPKQVTNAKANDDKKPAGGPLGQPVWNY